MTTKERDEDETAGDGIGEEEEEEFEESLEPGVELYRGRPSWVNYWKSLFLGTVVVAGGIVLWERNGWILFGALLLALAIYSYICLLRSMRLYVVTPRRVEVIYGLITKNSHEVRVQDIRAINVKKSGFKGLMGVGTVEFDSAGGEGAEVSFSDVWSAQRVKALVRELQDGDE